jgi:hypothetical protein
LFTEPPTTLNNYLVSSAYLEYAAFLLSDIEYFLLYTDIPTKASKFSHVEKRFQEIQDLILKSRDHYLSSNTAFHKPFKLHFDHLNWFYDVTFKEFNETFKIPDESGTFEQDLLDVMKTSCRFFDTFQAYLPINHNEFFIYESAKLSSKAFTDCFIAGENILSGNTKLSMEFTESALDMLERAYQAVDKESYRRQEYDALTISLNPRRQEYLSFKDYQDLYKIYIASCYQETVLMKQLFLVSSLEVDEDTSDEALDHIGETMDIICEKMPDFAATRNERAILMLSANLITSGQELDDLEMLFPPKEFSSILKSNSYQYLNNLPIKVSH